MAVLIIGYGNLLRRDDGVGQRIAETIADWKESGMRSLDLSAVESLPVHQLTLDLAERLSSVEQVIFVDACYSTDTVQVSVHRLELTESFSPLGHTCTPQSVLALTRALYGQAPQAWLVQVPGSDFEFGDRLSEMAEGNMEQALQCIQAIL